MVVGQAWERKSDSLIRFHGNACQKRSGNRNSLIPVSRKHTRMTEIQNRPFLTFTPLSLFRVNWPLVSGRPPCLPDSLFLGVKWCNPGPQKCSFGTFGPFGLQRLEASLRSSSRPDLEVDLRVDLEVVWRSLSGVISDQKPSETIKKPL